MAVKTKLLFIWEHIFDLFSRLLYYLVYSIRRYNFCLHDLYSGANVIISYNLTNLQQQVPQRIHCKDPINHWARIVTKRKLFETEVFSKLPWTAAETKQQQKLNQILK